MLRVIGRALTELHSQSYFGTATIDLDKLSFERVHRALESLKTASRADLPTLASNMWRNVLVLYGLEVVAEALPDKHPLHRDIKALLEDDGFTGAGSNNRLLGYIEHIIERIGAP
jgi:hypothetical protein